MGCRGRRGVHGCAGLLLILAPGHADEFCEAFLPAARRSQKELLGRSKYSHRFAKSLGSLRTQWTLALAQCALRSGVPGDFVETGVFTGVSSIAMLHALDVAGAAAAHRQHWACDSFLGLPNPSTEDACARDASRTFQGAAVARDEKAVCVSLGRGAFSAGLQTFHANVARARVGTTRLRTVAGWFNETLPPDGLGRISFLRLDGDLYASTRDALSALYPLVAPGGIVYSDDCAPAQAPHAAPPASPPLLVREYACAHAPGAHPARPPVRCRWAVCARVRVASSGRRVVLWLREGDRRVRNTRAPPPTGVQHAPASVSHAWLMHDAPAPLSQNATACPCLRLARVRVLDARVFAPACAAPHAVADTWRASRDRVSASVRSTSRARCCRAPKSISRLCGG